MTSIRSESLAAPEVAPLLDVAVAQPLGTILLVEDEDFVRGVTFEVLTFAGYHVVCARHAAEAMRVFREHEKDVQLLLTDVVLPGRSGQNLARDLKALHPGLKTVFMSGYPENDVTRQGTQALGVTYLPKPYSLETLMRAVQRAIAE